MVTETELGPIGPRKSMFILVVVIGCFSVLWPKVFYPMLVGNSNQPKPNPIDRTSGCCDVISEKDIITIKILTELCSKINVSGDQTLKDKFTNCRRQVLQTCGIDIDTFLKGQIQMGHNVKKILNEVRSINGSLCLKYNFGIDPWRLGVPHQTNKYFSFIDTPHIRQERPAHMTPEMLHPALRERGRAIPAGHTVPRIVEGRPGPIPGMRPPMGGPGHVVPPPTKGTSTMSVVMPIYTIGIVIFFTYTLMKIMFKKPVDGTTGLYPPLQPDINFRKQVFEAERSQYISRNGKDDVSTKLGDYELDQLRKRLRETELAMERIVAQMGSVPLKSNKNEVTVNGSVANGNVSTLSSDKKEPKEITKESIKETTKETVQESIKTELKPDSPTVKVVGFETTASNEDGSKWSRPTSPLVTSPPSAPVVEKVPEPEPQNIYLEGTLPAKSQLLVSDSATETEIGEDDESAVVLSSKLTLSVINLDNIDKVVKNGTDFNAADDEEVGGILDDEDGHLEESRYTTASNATHAENDVSGDEGHMTDNEEDIEED